MDTYQLRTFVAVAREGSITRASERLHLSQPAVSAHIKAIEEALGLVLFERTPRGMSLTREGERLLARAEQALSAHQELMDEASRLKGRLSGKLRLGANTNASREAAERLLVALSERCPEVDVALEHGDSLDIREGIRNGSLDAGYCIEAGEPDPALVTVEVSRFGVFLAAPPGLVESEAGLDWKALGELAWIYPAASSCCSVAAERLFAAHRFRPKRIVSVDRQDVTRSLVAGGVGLGLVHVDTEQGAGPGGEIDLLVEVLPKVRVLFAHLTSRAHDPVLAAASALVRSGASS